jgi:hypothetical protein
MFFKKPTKYAVIQIQMNYNVQLGLGKGAILWSYPTLTKEVPKSGLQALVVASLYARVIVNQPEISKELMKRIYIAAELLLLDVEKLDIEMWGFNMDNTFHTIYPFVNTSIDNLKKPKIYESFAFMTKDGGIGCNTNMQSGMEKILMPASVFIALENTIKEMEIPMRSYLGVLLKEVTQFFVSKKTINIGDDRAALAHAISQVSKYANPQ